MNESVLIVMCACFTVHAVIVWVVLGTAFRRLNMLAFALRKTMDVVKPDGWEDIKAKHEENKEPA